MEVAGRWSKEPEGRRGDSLFLVPFIPRSDADGLYDALKATLDNKSFEISDPSFSFWVPGATVEPELVDVAIYVR